MTAPPTLGRLHVIIDVVPQAEERAVQLADEVLAGGAPVIQVRAKGLTDAAWYEVAARVAARCRRVGAACIVNDRADLAAATGATGVHVGAEDLPVAAARTVVGPSLHVGGTARGPELAARHHAAGASYLGVGPVYVTSSKVGLPEPLSPAVLERIADAVPVPLIAISGITEDRIGEVLAAGAHGVAVIAAVARAVDPRAATARLVAAIEAGATTRSVHG